MFSTESSDIHRKALVAASSVVLAMGLGACARAPVESNDKPGAITDAGEFGATADPPGETTDGTTGSTTDSTTDHGGTGGSTGTVSTTETTSTRPGDDGGTTSEAPDCTISPPEELVLCCEDLMAWCTDAFDPASTEWADCVYGPGFDGSTGCIPWGPAVPPAASRHGGAGRTA